MHCNKKRRTSIDDCIKYFSEDKPNLETSTDDPMLTPMHLAAEYNNIYLLKGLLEKGHDPNVEDSFGATPLLLAAIFDHFDAVKLLLEKNADVFVTDPSNRSVLEILLRKSSILPLDIEEKLMNILINCAASIATVYVFLLEGNYDLKLVLYLKNVWITEEFLERKLMITNEESAIAIQFAMDRFDFENLPVLLNCGVGVDERRKIFYRKLLYISMFRKNRNLFTAKLFLERLNAWELMHEDALEYFYIMFGVADSALVELLLQCKVDVIVKEKFGLDLLAHVFENPKVNVIQLLQNWKFDVNARGESSSSALHFAVRGNSKENVQFLLNLGADIYAKNESGLTPLFEAIKENLKSIVEILLLHDAEIQGAISIFESTESLSNDLERIDPFGKFVNFEIQEYLIAQLIVSESKNKPISKSFYNQICSDVRCNEFYERCYRQIEKMKIDHILGSLTLFTVVTGEIEEISKHVYDEESAQLVEYECWKRKIHPYYYSTVSHKLNKIRELYRPKVHFTMVVSDVEGGLVEFDESAKNNFDMFSNGVDVSLL